MRAKAQTPPAYRLHKLKAGREVLGVAAVLHHIQQRGKLLAAPQDPALPHLLHLRPAAELSLAGAPQPPHARLPSLSARQQAGAAPRTSITFLPDGSSSSTLRLDTRLMSLNTCVLSAAQGK
jgi:hypothetical protein